MTAQIMQIGNRPCRIYGEAHAEYLLLQMTGEHELQSMAQTAHLSGTAAGISKTLTCARRKPFGGQWRNTHDHFD